VININGYEINLIEIKNPANLPAADRPERL